MQADSPQRSTRGVIRDLAEDILRQVREPLHNSELTRRILPSLGIGAAVTAKTVNTCLHDDPKFRFQRVGKGTWTLREFSR